MDIKEILTAPPGSTIWDTGDAKSVQGLHLRVFNKKKVFYLFYRVNGIQRKPSLGEYGVIDLKEARTIAKAILKQAHLGIDPKNKIHFRGEKTIQDVFIACANEHWSKPRFKRSGWADEAKRLYEKDIKGMFGKQKITKVIVEDVEAWHESYFDKPTTGNRALAVLSKLFTFAQKKRWIDQGINPCNLIELHKTKSRERYATPEEIQRVGTILERESSKYPAQVAFMYLLMFTGSRPSAIERATWDQLTIRELEGVRFGILRFDGKTGREQVIIPPQALKVIEKLPKIPGKTMLGICIPNRFWERVRKEAGCEDLWARDWRRTFATIGMSSDHDMNAISILLNHKSAQTTKIYAKLVDEAQADVAFSIANQMENLLKGKKTA